MPLCDDIPSNVIFCIFSAGYMGDIALTEGEFKREFNYGEQRLEKLRLEELSKLNSSIVKELLNSNSSLTDTKLKRKLAKISRRVQKLHRRAERKKNRK